MSMHPHRTARGDAACITVGPLSPGAQGLEGHGSPGGAGASWKEVVRSEVGAQLKTQHRSIGHGHPIPQPLCWGSLKYTRS